MATQTDDISMPSIACQTESINEANAITVKNEQQKSPINLAPRVGKGTYPCGIGTCVMELPHGRMIGHLRYHHKDVFYEVECIMVAIKIMINSVIKLFDNIIELLEFFKIVIFMINSSLTRKIMC